MLFLDARYTKTKVALIGSSILSILSLLIFGINFLSLIGTMLLCALTLGFVLIPDMIKEREEKAKKIAEYNEYLKNLPTKFLKVLDKEVTEAFKATYGINFKSSEKQIIKLAFWKTVSFRYNGDLYVTNATIEDNKVNQIVITQYGIFDGLTFYKGKQIYTSNKSRFK